VVECTALEMRHRCKPIGGSNPSLSAKLTVRICSLASQNFLKNSRIFDFYSALMFMSVRPNSWVNALAAWVKMRVIWDRRTWLILWVGLITT
jgi:hypothetical protein